MRYNDKQYTLYYIMKKCIICAALACVCLAATTSCTKNDVPEPSDINGGGSQSQQEDETMTFFTGSVKDDDGVSSRVWTCTLVEGEWDTATSYIGNTITMDSRLYFTSDITEFGEDGSWSVDGKILNIYGQTTSMRFAYSKLSSKKMRLQRISYGTSSGNSALEFKCQE